MFTVVRGSQSDYLIRYLNQYCAETLTRIEFEDKHGFPIENSAKRFKNVTQVRISFSYLGAKPSNLITWFPNLSHLEMESIYFSYDGEETENALALSFPHLKHLTIAFKNQYKNCLNKRNTMKLLHANQQFQSLCIYTDPFSRVEIMFSEILDMITGCPSIIKFGMIDKFI